MFVFVCIACCHAWMFIHFMHIYDYRMMLGIMDGKGRRGRHNNMEWIDNIKEWCNKDLYSLTTSALDRKFWKQTIKFALDAYGLQPMDSDSDDDMFVKCY